jgi:hypothetical protein
LVRHDVWAASQGFGDGYAEAHPELLGAFMHTAALDFQACTIAKAAPSQRFVDEHQEYFDAT